VLYRDPLVCAPPEGGRGHPTVADGQPLQGGVCGYPCAVFCRVGSVCRTEPRRGHHTVGNPNRPFDVCGECRDPFAGRLPVEQFGLDTCRRAGLALALEVAVVVTGHLDEQPAGLANTLPGDRAEGPVLRDALARADPVRLGVARAAVEHTV
jgi:hypothetical protein